MEVAAGGDVEVVAEVWLTLRRALPRADPFALLVEAVLEAQQQDGRASSPPTTPPKPWKKHHLCNFDACRCSAATDALRGSPGGRSTAVRVHDPIADRGKEHIEQQ